MTRPITLHAHEIRRLLDHGSALLVRPVKPQPDGELDGMCAPLACAYFVHNGICTTIACPLSPGSMAWGRERYTWVTLAENEYNAADLLHRRHPAGYPVVLMYGCDADNEGWADDVHWYSPVTMPRWASRLSVVVRSVTVKRVGDTRESEAARSGLEPYGGMAASGTVWCTAMRNWWTVHYGKQYPWPGAWVWIVELKMKEEE